jgi:hypothetical protein
VCRTFRCRLYLICNMFFAGRKHVYYRVSDTILAGRSSPAPVPTFTIIATMHASGPGPFARVPGSGRDPPAPPRGPGPARPRRPPEGAVRPARRVDARSVDARSAAAPAGRTPGRAIAANDPIGTIRDGDRLYRVPFGFCRFPAARRSGGVRTVTAALYLINETY